MANENSRDPTIPKPQSIPLAKIHDLSGIPISRQPDKSYGGLVTSIQASGVKEPVILRLREDGEYQLVTGYRRMRASELAKNQEIPALVYDMSLQEAMSNIELTEMFKRGWSTKADTGRGYGLFNARRLVEQHGGKIIIRNERMCGQNYLTIGALVP